MTEISAIDGVVLLDKPAGWTSNRSLQRVKRLFGVRKAGHTGSLDPLATGMLPICLGAATRLSEYLLDADKHYRVTCRLGVRTTTGDADGEPIEERAFGHVDRALLEQAAEHFRGEIKQVPPMYSALKHRGERLYRLARQGIEVPREPRDVTIRSLQVTRVDDDQFELDVRCSKGTYVRTLAEDLAEAVDTAAHVCALRRVGAGPYAEEDLVTMEELERLAADSPQELRTAVRPMDSALLDWPRVDLGADAAFYVRRGQPVQVARAPTSGRVRLYGADERFLGLGEILSDGRVAPRRILQR